MSATQTVSIHRSAPRRGVRAVEDQVAVEEPLEIRVEGRGVAVVMRTPGHDRELAAGFLLTEGIIRSERDLFDVTTCLAENSAGNIVDAALVHPETFDLSRFSRHIVTSASCGLCGAVSIESVMKRCKPLHEPLQVSPHLLQTLPARLLQHQAGFEATGGLHACALFDADGRLLDLKEDVGRHNALDKLIGRALLAGEVPLTGRILLLSGRASFEMVQKAHAGALGVIAAIGAPSSLAVAFAREAQQTLCGFLRESGMNIYAGAERIVTAAKQSRAKTKR